MDKFNNMPDRPASIRKEFGSDGVDYPTDGSTYGFNASELKDGYDQEDLYQAANDFKRPIGRLPTKRIDDKE